MKQKYITALLDMAERFGQTSTAERLKVGALIYKNDSVIALGVNGMPPKWPTEVCEDTRRVAVPYPEKWRYDLVTKPECRHAELAALEKLWNSSETADGSTMFISHSPCKNCSIKLVTAGIIRVYYKHDYRDSSGIKYLRENGVEVIKLGGNINE